MCAAPFSCVGDPRSALLGSVQFLFWFRLISPELRDVLAKRSPARGFSAAPSGSLAILAVMRRASSQILPVLSSFPSLFRLQRWTELNNSSAGGGEARGVLPCMG